jgi:hypothetical protein
VSDDYSYQGSADVGTALSPYNTHDFHIDQSLVGVRTATIVQIVKAPYDADGNPITPGSPVAIGYVDVQPLVNQIDGAGNATPHGTIYHLNYYRYQGGYGAFISDPKVGDQGKMVVADRDTSVVKATLAAGNPGSRRSFNMADGTYFGQTQGGEPNQWFAFTSNGYHIQDAYGCSTVTSGGNMTLTTSGSLNITAPGGCVINGATITSAGEVIDQNGIPLGTHLHSDAGGSGNSGPPIP